MTPHPWLERLGRLHHPGVQAALIVQCSPDWLRPERLKLRNDIDETLMSAQLMRGGSLTITRVVLHNLPVSVASAWDAHAVQQTFDEWNHRLAGACALLAGPAPRIHRVIIHGDQAGPPVPDMVELQENGHWSGRENADLVLQMLATVGATTPMTGYDVDLDGPFSDGDPSVHM
ncbi:hypothetical protein ACIBCM_17750 [Streptomyces sp. NPDC051018]|uniref:hypothetical protein n=1 Tax=Streptomyces sp. NPDC051018 TaxID=3365639 RepID=UPI00379EA6CD